MRKISVLCLCLCACLLFCAPNGLMPAGIGGDHVDDIAQSIKTMDSAYGLYCSFVPTAKICVADKVKVAKAKEVLLDALNAYEQCAKVASEGEGEINAKRQALIEAYLALERLLVDVGVIRTSSDNAQLKTYSVLRGETFVPVYVARPSIVVVENEMTQR